MEIIFYHINKSTYIRVNFGDLMFYTLILFTVSGGCFLYLWLKEVLLLLRMNAWQKSKPPVSEPWRGGNPQFTSNPWISLEIWGLRSTRLGYWLLIGVQIYIATNWHILQCIHWKICWLNSHYVNYSAMGPSKQDFRLTKIYTKKGQKKTWEGLLTVYHIRVVW